MSLNPIYNIIVHFGSLLIWFIGCSLRAEEGAGTSAKDIVFQNMNFSKHEGAILLSSTSVPFPGTFLLDTGSFSAVFDTQFTDSLRPSDSTRVVSTPSGPASVAGYFAPELYFNQWTIPAVPFCLCQPLDVFSQIEGVDIAGIIGMDAIDHHVVILDYDADSLTIATSPPSVDTESIHADLPLSMTKDGNARSAELTLAGHALKFLIDSGDDSLILPAEEFDRCVALGILVVKNASHSVDVMGVHDQRVGLLAGFTCGPFTYPPLKVARGIPISAGGEAVIGSQFLSRHHVVIDLIHNILHLRQRTPARTDPDRVNTTGTSIWMRNHNVEIAMVTPGSPSSIVGLIPGDLLKSINGQEARNLSLDELRSLIEGYPEHSLEIHIHRPSDQADHEFIIAPAPNSEATATSPTSP